MLVRRELLQLLAATVMAAGTASRVRASAPTSTAIWQRLAEEWLRLYPDQATAFGLDMGRRADLKSRLPDYSRKGVEADGQFCRRGLAIIRDFEHLSLGTSDGVTAATLKYAFELGEQATGFAFGTNSLYGVMTNGYSPHVLDQQIGSLRTVPDLLSSQHQIGDRQDALAYVERVKTWSREIDHETDRFLVDVQRRILPPGFLLQNVITQTRDFVARPPGECDIARAFLAKITQAGLPIAELPDISRVLSATVYPAAERQLDALVRASAKADDRAGVWRLSDGEAYYAWALRSSTTTDMTAAEVHQLGLEQTRALEGRMDAVLRKQGWTAGSVGSRMAQLSRDPKYLFSDDARGRERLVSYLNALIDRFRPRLTEISNLRLRAPVEVRSVPESIQDGAPLGYMTPSSIGSTRPSTYFINLKVMSNWPNFTLPTLTYHETIPGHAWEAAFLTETGSLPLVRSLLLGFNAYNEGWALYAEQLADELGMYDGDPLSELGYLQSLRFRAIRLVVDTGIHARQWSRDQAISWAVDNAGRPQDAMRSEVDRYCSVPAQACGYKVGHNRIAALREKQRAKLGKAFDVRAFNDRVVGIGPSPLAVLEQAFDLQTPSDLGSMK